MSEPLLEAADLYSQGLAYQPLPMKWELWVQK